jgi:hypothetical protein
MTEVVKDTNVMLLGPSECLPVTGMLLNIINNNKAHIYLCSFLFAGLS